VYFGGVSEFSSIFLCLAQIFEFYPPSSLVSPDSPLSSILPTIVTFSQAMFVITFFAFRIVGWAIMSYRFILDGSFIIKNRLCMKHNPGSGWFLWYLLTTSGLLGALQVFWLKEIVNKVLEMWRVQIVKQLCTNRFNVWKVRCICWIHCIEDAPTERRTVCCLDMHYHVAIISRTLKPTTRCISLIFCWSAFNSYL
jgi:hypothetical protein